jgi:hypothetical protein
MNLRIVLLALFISFTGSAHARDLGGVKLDDTVRMANGAALVLNGAGIRQKYFLDIYVAGLYLEQRAATLAAIQAADKPRRIAMHFVYKEVARDKLVEAWNEGFEANLERATHAALKPRIDRFNAMFETAHAGDRVVLDYLPGTGTTVSVNGRNKGTIEGKDFNDALLTIWLGEKPVTRSLKAGLLGG